MGETSIMMRGNVKVNSGTKRERRLTEVKGKAVATEHLAQAAGANERERIGGRKAKENKNSERQKTGGAARQLGPDSQMKELKRKGENGKLNERKVKLKKGKGESTGT